MTNGQGHPTGPMSRRSQSKWRRLSKSAHSDQTRFAALTLFFAIVIFSGGGSRSDIASLIFLRPLAMAFALYAAIVATKEQFAAARVPLMFLGGLALLMVVQLVPLPPVIWRMLPNRSLFLDIYETAGMSLPWLPIAVSPSRAVNSFFSLSVPLAALLLLAVQSPDMRARALVLVWIAAVLSMAWGMLQLSGVTGSRLYLYRITNDGLPVGLFANRNHQALLIGIGILLSGFLIARARSLRAGGVLLTTVAAGASVMCLLFLLIIGSRAGLVIGSGMLFPAAYLAYAGFFPKERKGPAKNASDRRLRLAAISGLLIIAGIFSSAIYFSRSLAFDRLMATGADFELRGAVLPQLIAMMKEYFPIGSGFGSFEFVYKRVEELELLRPAYLNHAHNDWLQFVIEGGAGALLLLLLFAAWLLKRLHVTLKLKRGPQRLEAIACLFIVLAFGVASVVDYPLRVPSLMAVFAIACGFLALPERERVVQDHPLR